MARVVVLHIVFVTNNFAKIILLIVSYKTRLYHYLINKIVTFSIRLNVLYSIKKTPFRDEPIHTIQIEWRIGDGFYQKKKRKAMIIYLPLIDLFTK